MNGMNALMHGEPFAVTYLSTRSGLSTVAAFFFADRVELCDSGALGLMRSDGWKPGVEIAAWCEAMRRKARHVEVVPDGEIRRVRFVHRMMQNELWIAREAGEVDGAGYRGVRRGAPKELRYALLVREQTDSAVNLLAARFGGRFELATTRVYAFVNRVAPLLTR